VNYNTFEFWLFFALLLALYWRLSHRSQNRLMLAASYAFYGCWDYRFLYLILISTVIDFIGGLGVAGTQLPRRHLRALGALLVGSALVLTSGISYRELAAGLWAADLSRVAAALPHTWRDFLVPLGTLAAVLIYGRALPFLYRLPEARRRKTFLVISMVANLAILGFFKYFDFFADSFSQLLGTFGLHASPLSLGLLLPVGISFYTFQAMSYTIDIYRGECTPTTDFLDFALFVCFFPHLVAGPIMRAHTLLPQVTGPRALAPGAIAEGSWLIALGLFKKVVIADNMAVIANAVFFRFQDGTAAGLTGPEVLIGVYAFAFQIYGDFSGYSAIARGVSKFFGYDLVINFDLPYSAQSPSDFWKRWHISLSSWLRDYLYIPLGGNRGGKLRQYRNLILTMLLGGLWHGASWTFVAWGLYHGLLLAVFRALGIPDVVPAEARAARLRRWGRVLLMFHLTCLGWLLFRADSFGSALGMLRLLTTDFTVTPAVFSALALMSLLAAPLLLLEQLMGGERGLHRFLVLPAPARGLAYAYVAVMLLVFHAEKPVDFIYFQF
jgi:D-alanyl-lipoteichoic acid acyltransferase DltB (MBOAT superfamily)